MSVTWTVAVSIQLQIQNSNILSLMIRYCKDLMHCPWIACVVYQKTNIQSSTLSRTHGTSRRASSVVVAVICMDGTGGSIPPRSVLVIRIVGSIPMELVLAIRIVGSIPTKVNYLTQYHRYKPYGLRRPVVPPTRYQSMADPYVGSRVVEIPYVGRGSIPLLGAT